MMFFSLIGIEISMLVRQLESQKRGYKLACKNILYKNVRITRYARAVPSHFSVLLGPALLGYILSRDAGNYVLRSLFS